MTPEEHEALRKLCGVEMLKDRRLRFMRFMPAPTGRREVVRVDGKRRVKRYCRWCDGLVPRPRISWCSQRCVDEYLVRSSSDIIRSRVRKRDHGVCALCGLDCEKLDRILRHANERYFARKIDGRWRLSHGWRGPRREILRALGLDGTSIWQADHIVPVIEGGGCCGLENYRTLCNRCHNRETALLRRRMANRRRGQLSLLEGQDGTALAE